MTKDKNEEENGRMDSIVAEMRRSKLDKDSAGRYSRQLLMDQIGVDGQLAISQTRVLVVGAGGLGSPVCLYLAAAGIGEIGIVDYDTVDLSNLHRQIIHKESDVGRAKVQSAKDAIQALNSRVTVRTFQNQLSRENAFDIVKQYDIVVDASDNPPTRYLVNDVCVLLNVPLVSASAIRMEGQLTVYNFQGGPCYRCLFPRPPPKGTVSNCEDGGVVGCVVGVLGSLQAMEVLKIAIMLKHPAHKSVAVDSSYHQQFNFETYSQKMLIYNAFTCQFRTVKLRGRSPACEVCSDCPSVKDDELIDYEQFCQSMACEKSPAVNLIDRQHRMTCQEYKDLIVSSRLSSDGSDDSKGLEEQNKKQRDHLLVDVRQKSQFNICSLDESVNITVEQLRDDPQSAETIRQLISLKSSSSDSDGNPSATSPVDEDVEVLFICRRGNRSQMAVKLLKEKYGMSSRDIIGGLTAWKHEVDPDFPMY